MARLGLRNKPGNKPKWKYTDRLEQLYERKEREEELTGIEISRGDLEEQALAIGKKAHTSSSRHNSARRWSSCLCFKTLSCCL